MTRRILAAAVLLATLAGCGSTAPKPHHQPARHCQAEYGHAAGQASHWARICQP